MREAMIAGVGMTRFGKLLDRNLKSLAAEVVTEALTDAGLAADDVGMVYFSNSAGGTISGQESIRGQVALRETGLSGLPIVNVENACASASTAVHLAWLTVASGHCDVALAVGAEKLYHPDKRRTFEAMTKGVDVEQLEELREQIGAVGDDAAQRSIFMDIYADITRRYMERSGATQRDFAQVAVKSHEFGALNPRAQYQNELTLEEVLDSRPISGPLTLFMCSPIGDGAAAVVVTSRDVSGRSGAKPIRILASVLASGSDAGEGTTVPATARQAYERAGVGPDDLDLVELHDATAPAELMLYEDLGLCEESEAAKLLWSGDTSRGGRVPVNTSGGLISKGHPIGASGCAQLVELVEQLRGQAGERQVEGAQIGLAENAGGYLGPDIAACAVTILGS